MGSCKPSCKDKTCCESQFAAKTHKPCARHVFGENESVDHLKATAIKLRHFDWMVSLTCDQVRQCPHGALQMRSSTWVPPHILGVALIVPAQFVNALLNVRHFGFYLRHTAETKQITPHLDRNVWDLIGTLQKIREVRDTWHTQLHSSKLPRRRTDANKCPPRPSTNTLVPVPTADSSGHVIVASASSQSVRPQCQPPESQVNYVCFSNT